MVSTMKMVDTKKAALRAGSSDGVRVNRTGRRTYTEAYKIEVVRQCGESGVSVAAVAMAHRINANLVRRWIVRHRRERSELTPKPQAVLLPVSLDRTASAPERNADHPVVASTRRRPPGGSSIEIELDGARIHLRGSVDAQALTCVLEVLWHR